MTQNEFFDYVLHNKDIKTFHDMFGGYFSYCPEFQYVYRYGKKMYSLANNDFKNDIKKSIANEENLLFNYNEVKF